MATSSKTKRSKAAVDRERVQRARQRLNVQRVSGSRDGRAGSDNGRQEEGRGVSVAAKQLASLAKRANDIDAIKKNIDN